MTRGSRVALGTERVAPNGYTYVQTEDGQRLKHHIIAEETLGRPVNTDVERVIFGPKGKTCFEPSNILVVPKKGLTNAAKRARLESRIEDLQGQLEDMDDGRADSQT